MRIHLTRDHDHVEPLQTIAFKGDREETVTKDVGEAVIKAGAARKVEPQKPDLSKRDG